MALEDDVRDLCTRARRAARALAPRPTAAKDAGLAALAAGLRAGAAEVLRANAEDLRLAEARGMASAMLDRLRLDEARVAAVAASVDEVRALPDPVGELISESVRPSGLRVRRIRVPIGVVAMIYEARPNVTIEASALTLKSGNAIVLRGGSEAIHTNRALAAVVSEALREAELPVDAVQLVPFTDRDAVRALVQQSDTVDLAIPRGGESLIRFVTEHARVPVVQHYKGVCHVFLDAGCDLAHALAIVENAKLQRPGVCNALECLLVAESDAARLLPAIADHLASRGCQLRGCERARAIVPPMTPATEADWGAEFLDRVLAVRVVDGLDGALAHIARYGSGHTEAIVTPSEASAARFRLEVDAACVAINASTRFHDGGQMGLGAEIGIATSRLHWRGPMGLESLTTMKWLLEGQGHVRG
ncbi:MAG: glutamate-5-semialdehyde dehydrogenase [Myxococcales bacterium]|nr:glutamate-5-semialdehyde dehydrogenase [Myxococcales bacterium]HQY62449.1 glutamate-5-semialdehyde dehydrogenase [Polyangiaceae bacterium]